MNNIWKILGLATLVGFIAVGCTEEPNNNAGEIPPEAPIKKLGGNLKSLESIWITNPEVMSLPGEVDGLGSAEEQTMKAANLRKPIVPGVGAAGITLATTLAESATLLTAPEVGPLEDGAALYNEEIIVVWKLDGERKPAIIFVSKGYLGTMEVGSFGKIGFQNKFTQYKGNKPNEGARRLTQEFYNELNDVADKSFDCHLTGACSTIYGEDDQPNWVMVMPGTIILFAKEEFQMAEIRIVPETDPGVLANNVDILTGTILVPEAPNFELGQTHEEIVGRVKAEGSAGIPEVRVDTDYVLSNWTGLYYLFHRTNYANDIANSEQSDRLKEMQITPNFSGQLTIGGQPIIITQSIGSVSFRLQDDAVSEPSPEDAEVPALRPDDHDLAGTHEEAFTMASIIPKANSMEFVTSFNDFVKTELSKRYDTVNVRVIGTQNQERINKEITSVISAYDSSNLEGVKFVYQYEEEQERMSFLGVGLIENYFNAFNLLSLATANEPVERVNVKRPLINEITKQPVTDANGAPVMVTQKSDVFTSLNGVELGDLVKLTDVDNLGRREASFSLITSRVDLGFERGEYVEQDEFVFYENGRLKPRLQGTASVVGGNLVLGLNAIGDGYARVVSIQSSNIYGSIKDVCKDLPSLSLKLEMHEDEIFEAIDRAVEKKRRSTPNYKCDMVRVNDNGALGALTTLIFPEQRIMLEFQEKTLLAVTVYSEINEANSANIQAVGK